MKYLVMIACLFLVINAHAYEARDAFGDADESEVSDTVKEDDGGYINDEVDYQIKDARGNLIRQKADDNEDPLFLDKEMSRRDSEGREDLERYDEDYVSVRE